MSQETDNQPSQPQVDPTLLDPTSEALTIRNQAIDEVLDPDSTLPQVTFVDRYERDPRVNQTSGRDSHNYAVLNEDGTEVGYARIGVPYGRAAERAGATAYVDKIDITGDGKGQDFRGRGYGKAIYREVLKGLPVGIELTCDSSVSPDALKMWRWLESRGLASRPDGTEEPVPGPKGVYENLGYKTNLAELADFAASKKAGQS